MLEKILGITTGQQNSDELYHYLPVRTTLKSQLKQLGEQLFDKHYQLAKNPNINHEKLEVPWGELIPNQDTETVKNDLVMLKLRGLIDHTKFSKGEELKKIPKNIQRGIVIEGDGFEMGRIKKGRKDETLVDTFLKLDQQVGYSSRKFVDIQKEKQRRKRITKKSVMARKKKFNHKKK